MRLGVAALAGTLGGTGILVQTQATLDWPAVLLLAIGVVVQTVATAVASGAAPPLNMTIGPAPSAIYRNIAERPRSVTDIRMALLDHAVLAHRHNRRSLERITRHRRLASLLLFIGTGGVLAGMGYVVGGAIVA